MNADKIDPDSASLPITDVKVRPCDDGSFCFGSDNINCCRQKQGLFVNSQGDAVSSNPDITSTTTSTSTSTSRPASSSTLSPTGTAQPASNTPQTIGGMSTGAKAGIGAGLGAAVLIAIGAGFSLWRRKTKERRVLSQRTELPGAAFAAEKSTSIDKGPRYTSVPSELSDRNTQELYHARKPVEIG